MSELAVMMKAKPSKMSEPMPEKSKPCLYVTDDDMPGIDEMKVGDEMTIKVRVRSKTVREGDDDMSKSSAELELVNGEKPTESENAAEDTAEEGIEE